MWERESNVKWKLGCAMREEELSGKGLDVKTTLYKTIPMKITQW